MQASEISDEDDYDVTRQLEAQIMIGQRHAHALQLCVHQLRAVALYWLIAGTIAAMAAIPAAWLAVASVRADLLRERLVFEAPGSILLVTLLTGLLFITLACIARAIGLRVLAAEAEMLSQSNSNAAHAGILALDGTH